MMPRATNKLSIFGTAALAVLAPAEAAAHLVNSGLGPFYDGALHLLSSPGDLLGLTAAALLAGLRGKKAGRITVVTLPAVWLALGLAGLGAGTAVELPWLSVLLLVVLGALVALDPRWLGYRSVALLAALFAAVQGFSDGASLAAAGAGLVPLSGGVVTVGIIALITTALVAPIERVWARIAVRVAGSWVAAVGMLMLGWLYGAPA